MRNPVLVLTALVLAALLPAEEGKWTPAQVTEIDAAYLAGLGLRIPARELWDPGSGAGLLSAAVSIGGCSAGFVSETGLIATNHHCIFGILQEHSTRENDIITKGFLARQRSAELPGTIYPGDRAEIVSGCRRGRLRRRRRARRAMVPGKRRSPASQRS
ncbi:MAG: S46 family peptidase [Bryobacterales bacterium]|nr:S46 family peptidase [Bryobacterales bacterium]